MVDNVPLNKRVSQADIDSLTNQMQHTLIRSVHAENAVNKKVDQMEDLVNQNDELTDEEKQAAIQVIEEHKNEIIGNIGDQTTDDGVTRIKDQGIQTLVGILQHRLLNQMLKKQYVIKQRNEGKMLDPNTRCY